MTWGKFVRGILLVWVAALYLVMTAVLMVVPLMPPLFPGIHPLRNWMSDRPWLSAIGLLLASIAYFAGPLIATGSAPWQRKERGDG